MNTKRIILAILSTIIKVAVIAVVLVFVYRTSIKAYDYGYRILEDKPIAVAPGRDVSVAITEGKSVKDIGEILESKGLVADANIFFIQNLLSTYRDELQPGLYTLNTSMTAKEMMEIMSAQSDDEEESLTGKGNLDS